MKDSVERAVDDLTMTLVSAARELGDRLARIRDEAPAAPRNEDQLYDVARRMLAERRSRRAYFPAELFHEPAWDILLALFVAGHEGRTVHVKEAVVHADAPVTTAQRWIDHLHRIDLIERAADPLDRRRIELSLSARGADAIRRYLGKMAAR